MVRLLSFVKLLQNESMKIYRRIGTWVMIGILLVVTLLFGILLKIDSPNDFEGKDWRTVLEEENKSYEKELAKVEEEGNARLYQDFLKESYAINQYRLDHNISPEDSAWEFVHNAASLISLITLFTIIVGAISVAGEFSWGTVKLLLIRPVSRSKILLSKYIATFQFALTMLVILFLFSFLIGALLFGLGDVTKPYLAYENGQVVEKNMFLHTLSLFGFQCIDLLMMATFAFMISAVFRSSSLAIGLAIFLMFTGVQLVSILAAMDITWVKYLLFANTDLTPYFDGTPWIEGMTLSFSITMLVIYFVLFNVTSWLIFNKRDVSV
mgnify:CR=1 FL=1